MFDDFAITATLLRVVYAIIAVLGLIWLSSHFDQRAKRTFNDSMEEMAKEPMALAIYFSGSYPQIAPPAIAPLWAGVWTILMGYFGALLAVFNVWLTFPREVTAAKLAAKGV